MAMASPLLLMLLLPSQLMPMSFVFFMSLLCWNSCYPSFCLHPRYCWRPCFWWRSDCYCVTSVSEVSTLDGVLAFLLFLAFAVAAILLLLYGFPAVDGFSKKRTVYCYWKFLDNRSLCYIWMYLDYRSLCCSYTCLHYRGLCCTLTPQWLWAVPRRILTTGACATSGRIIDHRILCYIWTFHRL